MPEFTELQWAAAVELRNEKRQTALVSMKRLAAVQRIIAEALAGGAGTYALRDLPGGEIGKPEPASAWNTENYHDRFSKCRMNPYKPYDPVPSGTYTDGEYKWIFLARDSLDRFVGKAPLI